MVAKLPSTNGAASAASPPSSACVVYSWPLAWKMVCLLIRPNWLIAPSTGQTRSAFAIGRMPGLSARVKKSLKLLYAAGSGSTASFMST